MSTIIFIIITNIIIVRKGMIEINNMDRSVLENNLNLDSKAKNGSFF
jgi:hypothetical protein